MPQYVDIPETSLARDISSLGLVETDYRKVNEFRNRKLQQQRALETTTRMEELSEEVGTIREEMSEIKLMLQKLIERG